MKVNAQDLYFLKGTRMKTDKNLGIWMDHSTANLIEFKDSTENQTIVSDFTPHKKVDTKNKESHESFYKEIAEELVKYDHVLLFGPTNAKLELNNYLTKDSHFKEIKIDIESADNMTDNEKDAFVKKHFETNRN